ncbi:MAG: sigma-70 family RNA polymerase sigma factor [Chloroflexi bacterium]|nr:MAG: sigma-70 family RNA polymerase sigma factor [Chloroflexota bacterium]
MIILILPDTTPDMELLARAKQGDREAQRVIYNRYFEPIYQFVRLRVDDREQARDITADVFLDFFVSLHRGRPPRKSLRAWLFRVARHKIYDHYGARQRLTTTSLEEWMPSDAADSPEAQAMHAHRLERVRRALQQLSEDQQEVLVLRFGQGLSLQETADLMDKSVSAVKSLQFRATEALRRVLGEEGT